MSEGVTPKQASFQAMKEVSSALIAIVLVLSAVFIPVAFMGGLTGEMYRQFAITIVISIVISGNRPPVEEYINYPNYIQFDHQKIDEILEFKKSCNEFSLMKS